MASQFLEIDWDNLSVGSNESFFDRVPLSHEPLQRALMKATVEKWNQEVIKCEERRRQSRAVTRKPTATIPPRGKSVPAKPAPVHKKPPSTIPVTPNVLKKRNPIPRAFKQPEQPAFVFKARPAPTSHKPPQHKSCGNLNRLTTSHNLKEVTKDLQKLTVKPVPASAPLLRREPRENKENAPKVTATTSRSSRLEVRSTNTAPKPRVRSNSVPGRSGQRTATIPVTPMVLKRNVSRTRTVSNEQQPQQKGTDYHFKAKPAGVLQRKPFKPKLAANHSTVDGPAPKAFDLGLEERIKERKMFNHRSTDALEKRQKQVEDEKRRIEDQQYAAARKMTNFRATRNPFK